MVFSRWKINMEPKNAGLEGMILRFHVKFSEVYMDVSQNGGTQQPWVFLLKMIILGCFGGTTI